MTTGTADATMIRQGASSDYDALLAILVRLSRGSAYTGGAELHEPHLAAMLARLLPIPDAGFLVAERDGVIVGLFVLMLSQDLMSGTWKASEVCWWVDPPYRDGLGLTLLRAGEAWAQRSGAQRIEMLSPDSKFDTVYRRRGYVMTNRVFERRL